MSKGRVLSGMRPTGRLHFGRERFLDHEGLVRSWTGALFTYQFFHAFISAETTVLPTAPGTAPIDWYENSRLAMHRAIAYAEENPSSFSTYGSCAWGMSAAEGPDDRYRAYGAPTLRASADPGSDREDGTIVLYPMVSAVSFGIDLRERALCAVDTAWGQGL